MKLIRAEAKAEGNPRLASGAIVDIKYVNKRYSGEYIAETVVHRFSLEEGYINEMYLKRNMFPSDYKAPGSGFVDKYADEAHRRRMAEQEAAVVAGDEDEINQDEEEDTPEFSNLMWKKDGQEIEEALIEDEVTLNFDVKNIDDGETVNVKIFEHDDDGEHDHIKDMTGKVENGKVEILWKVEYHEDNDDSNCAEEIEEFGYTVPEYYFVAEYNGVESEDSRLLYTKDWIKQPVKNEYTGEIYANRKFRLTLPDDTKIEGTTDENGYTDIKINIMNGRYGILFLKD